jgi:hypothetical protein
MASRPYGNRIKWMGGTKENRERRGGDEMLVRKEKTA